MELRDWIAYPHQVDAKVAAWQTRFPQYLEVDTMVQYTRHKVYALTVTDRSLAAAPKRKLLCFVPHAHEPAGTVACLNFISQLLTGKHLDGCPSTLMRAAILERTLLVFIPDGNPYGRARSPEPFWEGKHFDNTEFMHLVFGIDTLSWETFKRVARWSVEEDPPAYLGIVYEPINEYEYVEPNRGDEAASLVKLVRQLEASYTFDQVLNLHQTEFEGYVDEENCFAMLPALQAELPPEQQAYNLQWAQSLTDAWTRVDGGRPAPVRGGGLPGGAIHRQSPVAPWSDLQRQSPMLTIEIQNNSPHTLHELQLLLMETAISHSIERLMGS
jgi:hypothetical protein